MSIVPLNAWQPRRLAPTRVGIAIACPGSHRPDTEWVPQPSHIKQRAGQAFHTGCEAYPHGPDIAALTKKYDLTANAVATLEKQWATWHAWMLRRWQPAWRTEIAFAYDPLTERARELDKREADERITRPGEMYARMDSINGDGSAVRDWKSGVYPVDPPKMNPQMWSMAAIVAAAFGRTETTAAVVQVGPDTVSESSQPFDGNDLASARKRLRMAVEAITPDAPYTAGAHCGWCPAKPKCSTYAAWVERQKQAPAALEEKLAMSVALNGGPSIPTAKRMTLASVRTDVTNEPIRVLVHGVDKIGKSTFAMGSPSPVFIGVEGGLARLGPARFPEPKSFDDVLEAVTTLRADSHDYRTLVIDPVNWVEPLVFAKVCGDAGKQNIEDFGYGKGYVHAAALWQKLIDALEDLRIGRGMNVVLLAHTQVRNAKNTDGIDWGAWQPAMRSEPTERIKQWVDAILFAKHDDVARTLDTGKRIGRTTGARVLLTQPNAGYAAGNRLGLPESIPLSWAEFTQAVETARTNAAGLKQQIAELARQLGVEAKAHDFVVTAGSDVNKLNEILNALTVKQQEVA